MQIVYIRLLYNFERILRWIVVQLVDVAVVVYPLYLHYFSFVLSPHYFRVRSLCRDHHRYYNVHHHPRH